MLLLKGYHLHNLTSIDYVRIVSTVEGFFEKKFNCVECRKRYDRHPDPEKMWESWKARMSCYDIKEKPKFQLDQIRYYTCPGNFFSFSVASLMEGYHNYKLGVMPYKGSFFEQPAKIIEVYKMIEAIIEEKKADQIKQHEKDLKRRSGSRNGRY